MDKIATSKGKNKAKTGRRIVPKPKPEKKVAKEPTSATMAINTMESSSDTIDLKC